MRALVVASVEGASVFLDEIEQCKTPCQIKVPFGDRVEHEIRLTKKGFEDVEVRWQPRSPDDDLPAVPPLRPATAGP